MTKVLHLLWSGHIGGAETLLLNVLNQWQTEQPNAGYSHHLAVMNSEGELMESFQKLGIPIYPFRMDNGFHRVGMRHLKSLWPVIQFLRKNKFDLIHVHASLLAVIICGIFSKSRVIMTCHGVTRIRERSQQAVSLRGWYQGIRERLLWKWVNRYTERFVVASQFMRECMAKALGITEEHAVERIELIYNGVTIPKAVLTVKDDLTSRSDQVSFREQWGIDNNSFVIGMASRFIAGKGIELIIHAMALIPSSKPICLVLAGDGPLLTDMEKLVVQLKAQDRIRFIGWQREITSLHANIQLFCFPSQLKEGFGLALTEAMAAGLPILTSTGGAVPEIVIHNECGWIIPPSPEAYAKAIIELYDNPDTRASLSHGAKARIQDHFNIELMCNNTLSFYERVLASGNTNEK